jgi:FkbM family methyltransferase
MGFAKRVFRRLPMGVKSPAVSVMKLVQKQTAVGKFYSRAEAMNIVELSVRGDYGVFTQSVADRTMLPVYATTGKWNHEMNERLTSFFSKDGGTYVDVGANIGLTLVPLAQNPNVDIIAFEPDPSNFHYLTRNVADNCTHGNVTLHRLAAFKEKTELSFELSPDNLGNHRIRLKDEAGALSEQFRKTIVVEAVRLDDVVEVKRKPLAVKIDTEGAESFVIEGGPRLLSEAQLFFTEIWPYGIARMGGDIERVAKLIKDNFKTFHIPPDFGAPEMAARSAEDFIVPLMNRSSDPWFHFDLVAVK